MQLQFIKNQSSFEPTNLDFWTFAAIVRTNASSTTKHGDYLTVLQVTDASLCPAVAELVIYSRDALKVAGLGDVAVFRNLKYKLVADKLIGEISSSAKDSCL